MIDTQTLEASRNMNFQERIKFFALVRAYKRLHFPSIAQKLEAEYGMCIDVKDYGADQNVEVGSLEY